MAKETKAKRKSGGKKAFRTRLANAKAAGKKTIKLGKRRISTTTGKAVSKEVKAKKHKPAKRSSAKRETARREGMGRAMARGKRKGGKRKASRKPAKTRHIHHTKTITKRRTVEVKVPGKTRKVYLTAADRRGRRGHRRGHRRAREGYAMENPLSGMEVLGGGLAMLFGLAVADVSDRYLATHALTANTAAAGATTTTYTDTPVGTAGTVPTSSFGTGLYPGMLNGASVIAPMNMTRWVSGGAISILPFVAAAFVKNPTVRSGLQFFGFGALARIGGKALVDMFAGLLGSTSIGQQLYVNELAATGQYQAAMGQAVTVTLPNITGTVQALGTGQATGLARAPQPSGCCCNACSRGMPCNGYQPAQSTPAQQQQQQSSAPPTTTIPTPGGGGYTPVPTGVPASPAPSPPTTVSTPGLPTAPPQLSVSYPGIVGLIGLQTDPSQSPLAAHVNGPPSSGDSSSIGRPRPNPFDWSSHITAPDSRVH